MGGLEGPPMPPALGGGPAQPGRSSTTDYLQGFGSLHALMSHV